MKHTNPLAVLTSWIALLVGLVSATPAAEVAGTGTITGRVLNQGTGQYLEGAQVEAAGSGRSVLTSRLGYFELSGLPPGPQQQFNYGRKKVDVSLAYAFSPRFTLYADVVNVFGDTFMAGGSPYIYIPARKRGADEYPPEIKFGVSGRF